SETVKTAQKNWIGKSKGAEIDFRVVSADATGSDEHKEESSNGASGTNEYSETSSADSDAVIAESANSVSSSAGKQVGTTSRIRVFTTRPDTIYGATFMVLAPEHDLVEKITTPEQKEAI